MGIWSKTGCTSDVAIIVDKVLISILLRSIPR